MSSQPEQQKQPGPDEERIRLSELGRQAAAQLNALYQALDRLEEIAVSPEIPEGAQKMPPSFQLLEGAGISQFYESLKKFNEEHFLKNYGKKDLKKIYTIERTDTHINFILKEPYNKFPWIQYLFALNAEASRLLRLYKISKEMTEESVERRKMRAEVEAGVASNRINENFEKVQKSYMGWQAAMGIPYKNKISK